jgi:hypothetical protein
MQFSSLAKCKVKLLLDKIRFPIFFRNCVISSLKTLTKVSVFNFCESFTKLRATHGEEHEVLIEFLMSTLIV